MTVIELYNKLCEIIPTTLSCPWDKDGLESCPEPNKEVKKVLITLDITNAAIDRALEGNFDVIVSHHPLIFSPLKRISATDAKSRRIMKLLSHNISVMSFHTRLDAAPGGLNDVFAKLMGLSDVETVEVDGEAVCRIGTVANPTTCAEFAAFAKKTLGAERVLYAESGKPVHRVAVCGGDGKDFVKAVKAAGADSYITGQLSYNLMEEASEIGLNMFEAGHFFTEDFIVGYLTLLILKEYTQVQTAYFGSNLVKAI